MKILDWQVHTYLIFFTRFWFLDVVIVKFLKPDYELLLQRLLSLRYKRYLRQSDTILPLRRKRKQMAFRRRHAFWSQKLGYNWNVLPSAERFDWRGAGTHHFGTFGVCWNKYVQRLKTSTVGWSLFCHILIFYAPRGPAVIQNKYKKYSPFNIFFYSGQSNCSNFPDIALSLRLYSWHIVFQTIIKFLILFYYRHFIHSHYIS